MAAIDVTETGPGTYRVVVTGDAGTTTHEVTAAPATIADLGGDVSRADLGGDVSRADLGGDVSRADLGGDVSRADLGGDASGTDVGGDVSRADLGGDVSRADLGGGASGTDVVAASFEFLLAREPQHAILAGFDLTVIARYFPDYPAEMRRRFEAT